MSDVTEGARPHEDMGPLFRREAAKLLAALTRALGVHSLPLAEDVVQDALIRALETWKVHGVPENPGAWLMRVAKNRAIDVVRRDRRSASLDELAEPAEELVPAPDDELRMMFSCCHPKVPAEAQIALILSVLSGFGVSEIAAAFLAKESAVEKRLARAKAALAETKHLFDFAKEDISSRLETVQRALYLLFNEGYHGANEESAVRTELCREAMHLVSLLRQNSITATPSTHALAGLMCFHAARLAARVDPAGELVALVDQDRSKWDRALVMEGEYLLNLSARGDELSEFHLEAAIAHVHLSAPSAADTQWSVIVGLYDRLLAIRPSPVISLNRAIAVAQAEGPERGREALLSIPGRERLETYPFYAAALGEIELRCGNATAAHEHYRTAIALARSPMERRFLQTRAVRSLPIDA
ncbi:MAG: sigma-70 family RNA polymerase sigma factor [Labilithrix sp.]